MFEELKQVVQLLTGLVAAVAALVAAVTGVRNLRRLREVKKELKANPVKCADEIIKRNGASGLNLGHGPDSPPLP